MRHDLTESLFNLQAIAHLPYIRTMAMLQFEPIWSTQWHRSWCCELHYILNGTLTIKLKSGRRITGSTSELVLVPAGLLHRDDYTIDTFPHVFMVFFSWNVERWFWRMFPLAERGVLRVPINREITGMFDRIQTTFSSGTPADEIVTRTYLLAVLLLIVHMRQVAVAQRPSLTNAAARRRKAIMLKAKQYADQHFEEHVTLGDIATALKISAYYLSHVFSRESDFSLFKYLTDLRMRKARLLLQQSDATTVKEVAYAVGYDDLSYFSKAFQRHFGVSPRILQGAPYAVKRLTKRHRR